MGRPEDLARQTRYEVKKTSESRKLETTWHQVWCAPGVIDLWHRNLYGPMWRRWRFLPRPWFFALSRGKVQYNRGRRRVRNDFIVAWTGSRLECGNMRARTSTTNEREGGVKMLTTSPLISKKGPVWRCAAWPGRRVRSVKLRMGTWANRRLSHPKSKVCHDNVRGQVRYSAQNERKLEHGKKRWTVDSLHSTKKDVQIDGDWLDCAADFVDAKCGYVWCIIYQKQ